MNMPTQQRKGHPVLGWLVIIGMGWFFAAHASDPAYAAALGWLVLTVIVALLVRWVKSRKRTPRTPKVQPVSVAVTRPVLPVPEMLDIYRALPAHCLDLFDAGGRR
ncbi:MAG: hypothetical protein LBF16_03425 [Pseudomonadales bacterium]|jgi:hypothetical protein|nr:hypothetical protein [Pseudomonadales bacterium]